MSDSTSIKIGGGEASFQRGQQLAHEVLAARIYGEDWTDDPAPRVMPHLQAAMDETLTAFATGDATMIGAFCFVLARWASVTTNLLAEEFDVPAGDLLQKLIQRTTNPPG